MKNPEKKGDGVAFPAAWKYHIYTVHIESTIVALEKYEQNTYSYGKGANHAAAFSVLLIYLMKEEKHRIK